MSLENAHRFVRHLDIDSDLLAQVNAIDWNSEFILKIAHEHGYVFTEDQFQTAVDEVWGVLSEDELANVAGGAPGGNSGHENPPPGHRDGHPKEGTWSPPPGEVSGMSCFFGWRGR